MITIHPCPWDERTWCVDAAKNDNNLEVLKWWAGNINAPGMHGPAPMIPRIVTLRC